jgi:hypothetical protein
MATYDGLYHLLRRRDRSLNEIDLFQDLHLGGRNIADTIDTGERSFAEFLRLLDEASKFKSWLVNSNPDRKLITEYLKQPRAKLGSIGCRPKECAG